jgi:phosphatidylinositol glycan class B
MAYLEFYPQFRAMILSAVPGATQAVFAGVGDFYTWQLAQKLYGVGSTTAWTTVS